MRRLRLSAACVAVLLTASAATAGSVGAAVLPPQIHTVAGAGSCGAPTIPPTQPSPLASGQPCDGVPATSVAISGARSVAALPGGGFLYVDAGNDLVREVSPDGTVTTVAGDGTTTDAPDGTLAVDSGLNGPVAVAPLPGGGFLVTEYNGSVVRMVSPGDPSTATITTIAGTGTPGNAGQSGQPATSVQLNYPTDAEPTGDGGVLIADRYNHDVKLLSAAAPGATVTTIAGGAPTCADATASCDGMQAGGVALGDPVSVSPIASGGYLIAEYDNDAIRMVSPSGTFTTVAGTPGDPGYGGDGAPATSALLDHPEQVVATADGGFMIADTNNEVIRQVSPAGMITTIAGNHVATFAGDGGAATAGSLFEPAAISPMPGGGFLIADGVNNAIRAVTIGPTTTFALTPAMPNGQNGWYVSAVNVAAATTEGAQMNCTVDPGTTPLTFAYLPSGCPYTGSGASISDDGAHVVYAASVNGYGDKELPVSVSMNIDTTPPTLQCVTPAPNFALNQPYQLVTATVTDATSGPAAARVSATAPTSTFGNQTVTLTGADNAGNTAAIKCPYTVLPAVLSPTPVLTAKFLPRRQHSTVEKLMVSAVPAQASVNLACKGKGCPFASASSITGKECKRRPCTAKPPRHSAARRTVDLRALFASSRLSVGAKLTVSVTEANTIGRVWLITILAKRQPTPQLSCLAPGSSIPGKGCTAPAKPKKTAPSP